MRILYLCHRIPYPPDKGEKIRAHHYLRHLSARHEVHVACLVDDPADLAHREGLRTMCESVEAVFVPRANRRVAEAAALLSGKPLSVASFQSRDLAARVVRRLRAGVDVLVAQSAAMAEYIRGVEDVPRVMDFVDLDSEKWRVYARVRSFPWRALFRLEAARVARYEDEVARAFDLSVFISSKEAELLGQRVPDAPVRVIPNGVDLEYFSPGVVKEAGPPQNAVVFTGVMDYFPNVDAMGHFCRDVLPRLRSRVPDVQVFIVGRNPARDVRKLEGIQGVIVTGAVADTRPWMARAKVSVAPFRVARGVQNKVLEALAMGLPVVGTEVAFQGIPATGADGIEIAADPEAFAAAVARLLLDDDQRASRGAWARAFAEREFRWHTHAGAFESALVDVLERRRAMSASVRA